MKGFTENNDLKYAKIKLHEEIQTALNTARPYIKKFNLKEDLSGEDLFSINMRILENLDYMILNVVSNFNQYEEIKEQLKISDNVLTYIIEKKTVLTEREQALVDRGYDIDTVKLLTKIDKDVLEKISSEIYDKITKDHKKSNTPICLYIGGQPGAGKSSTIYSLRENNPNLIEIGIDNYRTYHPNYLEMEKAIRKHWQNREITSNDSPGNDIADFTHKFAGDIEDILIDKISKEKYDIALEWSMREATAPLKTMEKLKQLGYTNIVNFIVTDKKTSMDACNIRANVMNNQSHIIRRVPESFHEKCIRDLPNSCDEIYKVGYIERKIIDNFSLTDRNGNVLWNKGENTFPGNIYRTCLENTNDITYNNSKLAEESYKIESSGIEKSELNNMLNSNEIETVEEGEYTQEMK